MPQDHETPQSLLGDVSDNNTVDNSASGTSDWARRRDIAFAILGWLAVIVVALWGLAHIIAAVLILIIAALFAYALAPAVKVLQRWVWRPIAIALVYIGVITAVVMLGYVIVYTAVDQVVALARQVPQLLGSGQNGLVGSLVSRLHQFGITRGQIEAAAQQLTAQLQGVAQTAVPFIEGVFGAALDIVLITVISVYLMIDGHRAVRWLQTGVPLRHRGRVMFIVKTFERVVGGYIRGEVALAALVGALVGAGMLTLHVPYAVLLGVLAFVLEFIPIIGVFISGTACVLLALTQSWVLAILVLAYFVFVHIIEGDVVGPRIVGRAVGVHPVVSMFALLAGAELFGIWGALFASPVAGVIQAILTEMWREWRDTHANQFPEYSGPPVVPVTTDEAVKQSHTTAASSLPGARQETDASATTRLTP